ncbi:MAG: YdcF family protein [Wenzhouxiangella sp.]|nr:YdcF family protein [Wenzhouxiangella sp.]TVR92750.1 MAG: YdcF family protein [Wenzhouxiangellaceae bacterium]
MHDRSLRRVLDDPALLESFIASLVVLVLTLGASLILAWLWVCWHAMARNRQPVSGYVLVCGHQLDQGLPSADFVERLQRAAELARCSTGLRLVLLGGGHPSEARAGLAWLETNTDIDPGRVVLEEDSTDSFENLRFARDLLGNDQPLALLSSRYHLGRLRIFSAQLGLSASLVPAESALRPGWRLCRLTIQEAAYVCWFVSGLLWAQLARRRHLLDRIR